MASELKGEDDRNPYLKEIWSIEGRLKHQAQQIEEIGTPSPSSETSAIDEDVRLFVETLRVWASFLEDSQVQELYVGGRLGRSSAFRRDHLHQVESVLAGVTLPLERSALSDAGQQLRALLASIFTGFDQMASLLPELNNQSWWISKHKLAEQLDRLEQRALLRAVSRVNQAADASEKGAAAIARAAGKTGDEVMSSFYAGLAKKEAEAADKFRRFTVGFAMAGGVLAFLFVMLPTGIFPQLDALSNDYVRLIQKTVLIAGVFGIAGYFARQAHQHRSMANWAESLSVQLQTFDAYVLAVDSGQMRDELRKNFAARAFGDHPAMKGDPMPPQTAAAVDTAVGLAAKLMPGSAK